MRVTLALAVALALAVSSLVTTATPVSAKTTQATELLPRWKTHVGRYDRARLEAIQYLTDCIARKQRPLGVALLAAIPGSEQHDKLLEQLTWNPTCLSRGGAIAMYTHEMRGGIAQGLMRGQPLKFPATATGTPATEDFEALKAAHERASGERLDKEDLELLTAYSVARCVVRKDVDGVVSLVASEIASVAELQRLHALSPAIAACNGSAQKLHADRHSMRDMLGEALYGLAVTEVRVSS